MRLRTLLAASAVGLSIACIAGFASAQQIYKWKDSSGVVHFSQTPPSSGAHYTKVHLTGAPEVASGPTAAPVPSADAADDVVPPPEAANPPSSELDTPSNRAQLCKQLSSNISLLQGKTPVVTAGAGGKQQVMSDTARQQQLATARTQQTQYCSGGGH